MYYSWRERMKRRAYEILQPCEVQAVTSEPSQSWDQRISSYEILVGSFQYQFTMFVIATISLRSEKQSKRKPVPGFSLKEDSTLQSIAKPHSDENILGKVSNVEQAIEKTIRTKIGFGWPQQPVSITLMTVLGLVMIERNRFDQQVQRWNSSYTDLQRVLGLWAEQQYAYDTVTKSAAKAGSKYGCKRIPKDLHSYSCGSAAHPTPQANTIQLQGKRQAAGLHNLSSGFQHGR